MAELPKSRDPGSIQPNTVRLRGSFVIGATGAVGVQTGNRACGVTWSRTTTGDYRATLHKAYRKWMSGGASISVAALATVPTLAGGNQVAWAGITSGMLDGTSGVPVTGLGLVTFRTDTDVLADPTSGVLINWWCDVSESL